MEERTLFHQIYRFFDKLEDHARRWLSHRTILYGFVGGIGAVLFWRGVWHTADYLSLWLLFSEGGMSTIDAPVIWDGLLSFIVGSVLLLMTGLFVSSFIGNEILISGMRGEKKVAEKTEEEIKVEGQELTDMERDVREIKVMIAKLAAKKGGK